MYICWDIYYWNWKKYLNPPILGTKWCNLGWYLLECPRYLVSKRDCVIKETAEKTSREEKTEQNVRANREQEHNHQHSQEHSQEHSPASSVSESLTLSPKGETWKGQKEETREILTRRDARNRHVTHARTKARYLTWGRNPLPCDRERRAWWRWRWWRGRRRGTSRERTRSH